MQRLRNLLLDPHGGLYSSDQEAIIIKRSILDAGTKNTLTHEIKHKKLDDVLKIFPSFEKEWGTLSSDKDGKRLYFDDG